MKTHTQQIAAQFGEALARAAGPGERFGFDVFPAVRGGAFDHVLVLTLPSPVLGEDLVAIIRLARFTLTPAEAAKLAGELTGKMRQAAREQLAAGQKDRPT